jgi:hypothetical protein
MSDNSSTSRRRLMRTWTVVAVVAVLVVVALVKITGVGGTGSADGSSPGAVITKLPQSYPPLLAAVDDYFALIADGHKHKAYRRAVSDRCRHQETFDQFRRAVGNGQLADGTRIHAYRSGGPNRGAVQFINPDTPFTPLAWPWIKERGVWKEDGCP